MEKYTLTMKYYNQKYGFEKGDALLQSFAQLLTGYFKTQNCSRFGQDHFAVYTDEQGLEDTLRHIFEDWESIGGEGQTA